MAIPATTIRATRNTTPLDDGAFRMKGLSQASKAPASPSGGLAASVAVPGLLLAGHLLGGASDLISASFLTAGVWVALLVLALSERRPFRTIYLGSLLWAGLPFILLLVFVALSLAPGSAAFAAGPLAKVVGARTLAIDAPAALLELLKLGGLGAMVLIAERLATSARRLRQTLKALIGLGVVWTGWSLLLLAIDSGTSGVGRLSGAFVSPNVAGALIATTLLLLVGDHAPRSGANGASIRWRSMRGLSAALFGGILVVGLVLTASRACATIGLGLSALLWLWPRGRGLLARLKGGDAFPLVGGLVAAVCASIALFAGVNLVSRLSQTSADAGDRWAIMQIYASAASDAPWTGYGLGSASALSRLLITADNYAVFWNIRAAHNLVVQWWLEGGVVGLGLGASLLGVVAIRALGGLGAKGRLALGGPIAALAFLGLHGMVDYDLQIYSVALTSALLIGVCLAGGAHSAAYWDRFSNATRRKGSRNDNPSSPNAGPEDRFFEG